MQKLQSKERPVTCVLVLCLVHLAVGAFPDDADDIKFVNTAFPPVTLHVFAFTITWTANPAVHQKNVILLKGL